MQKVLTRADVLEYSMKGIKAIELDEKPILTDLARDALKQTGIEIHVGSSSCPDGQPKSGRVVTSAAATAKFEQSGGYGAGGSGIPEGDPVARKLATPIIDKEPFRDVICSDRKLVGTFIGTPHPVMTEFVGHLGFDFVCIDAEHNAITLESLQKMLQGLQGTPTYGMVRVPTIGYEYISGALDIGADALLIPQVRTLEDIEEIRHFSLYPPLGRRGCGPSRLWDYGDGIGQLGTLDGDMNYTTNIVVQIETVEALKNLERIIETDFVDMFFIGPGDLSMDMGIFGQFSNPKLVDAIMMIREKTAKAGKRLGVFAGTFEAAKNWFEKDFDMVLVNSELAIMSGAVSEGMKVLAPTLGR